MVFSIDRIFVTAGALVLLVLVWSFFFRKRSNAVLVEKSVTIVIDGGYSPDAIILAKGEPSRIIFKRKDPSACLEEVILPHFGIRKHLPLDQEIAVDVLPEESGEFSFSCGMNMFHGRIIVP